VRIGAATTVAGLGITSRSVGLITHRRHLDAVVLLRDVVVFRPNMVVRRRDMADLRPNMEPHLRNMAVLHPGEAILRRRKLPSPRDAAVRRLDVSLRRKNMVALRSSMAVHRRKNMAVLHSSVAVHHSKSTVVRRSMVARRKNTGEEVGATTITSSTTRVTG
jgi:hypothetical protein